MATKSGKTQVDSTGLRFTSRENGSPFVGMGKVGETMSCIKCGLHKPRRLGSQRRFAGGLAFFCHDCKPPQPKYAFAKWRADQPAALVVQTSRRKAGNKMTSRMLGLSVSNIIKRSMPIPHPPVGGMPNSSARTKSWSKNMASSSPLSFAATWA